MYFIFTSLWITLEGSNMVEDNEKWCAFPNCIMADMVGREHVQITGYWNRV